MIGYGDVSYCVSTHCKNKCGRKLTDEIKIKAQAQWIKECGSVLKGPLFSVSYFCDNKGEVIVNEKKGQTTKR